VQISDFAMFQINNYIVDGLGRPDTLKVRFMGYYTSCGQP
jgi:hypothetical protein